MSAPKCIAVVLVSLLLAGAAAHAQPPRPGEGRDQAAGPPGLGERGGWHRQGGGGAWLRKHQDLPPAEQQRALERDPAFQRLSPERQQALRQRLEHFNSLPPEQRQRVLQRMEAWSRLTPEQRDRARGFFGQYRSLPDDRRQAVSRAYRNLREMTPQERQRIFDSPAFHSSFNDQERNILRGMTDLNVGPPPGGPGAGERPPAYVPRPPYSASPQ